MNGNFTFGDYFKEDAIKLAWDAVDQLGRRRRLRPGRRADLGHRLPRRRRGDRHLAPTSIGLPMERIVRRGMDDNFWSMGIPGPCGPCSELYYDRGPDYGREGGPEVDEDRYMEFWNLVFMQNERGLDRPGQGRLRRSSASCRRRTSTPAWAWSGWPTLLQGVDNLYEIDETRPILDRAAELSGKRLRRALRPRGRPSRTPTTSGCGSSPTTSARR